MDSDEIGTKEGLGSDYYEEDWELIWEGVENMKSLEFGGLTSMS
jgi:hypothetical protein